MKKTYYLEYGSSFSKEEIHSLLAENWDIVCSENDSLYFGVYFRYSGLHADKLTIKDNFLYSNEWLNEGNKQFATIINMAFTNGRNADKLSRYKFMKNVMNQLKIAELIMDEHREEEF
ncbi:hypothetical protein HCA06_03595 [Listeria welshimeri]|nr:hypothetical protein [Listeria welshimeri]